MIRVNNLTYTYPGAGVETLHGLNFEIAAGEIFGFLGPSGAGKTTTQNILIGLLREYGGSVQVMDREISMMVAGELCDRVAFITAGDISLIDAPKTLKKLYGRREVRVAYQDGGQAIQHQEFPLDGLGHNHEFISLLKSASYIDTIHTQETTLDNIFIEVTGQELSV